MMENNNAGGDTAAEASTEAVRVKIEAAQEPVTEEEVKPPITEFSCDLCSETITNMRQAMEHINGKQHKRKLELHFITKCVKKEKCELCGTTYDSLNQVIDHLNGYEHANNIVQTRSPSRSYIDRMAAGRMGSNPNRGRGGKPRGPWSGGANSSRGRGGPKPSAPPRGGRVTNHRGGRGPPRGSRGRGSGMNGPPRGATNGVGRGIPPKRGGGRPRGASRGLQRDRGGGKMQSSFSRQERPSPYGATSWSTSDDILVYPQYESLLDIDYGYSDDFTYDSYDEPLYGGGGFSEFSWWG